MQILKHSQRKWKKSRKRKRGSQTQRTTRKSKQTSTEAWVTTTLVRTPAHQSRTQTPQQANQNRQTEGVHFDPNTVQHYYTMTRKASCTGRYELPANHSIIQAAATGPPRQLTTNPINGTGHNEAWRNNVMNTQIHTSFPPCTTRMTGHNGLFNDSPNSSGNRNTPTCFTCCEQGHMRHECRNRGILHPLQKQQLQWQSMQETHKQHSQPI